MEPQQPEISKNEDISKPSSNDSTANNLQQGNDNSVIVKSAQVHIKLFIEDVKDLMNKSLSDKTTVKPELEVEIHPPSHPENKTGNETKMEKGKEKPKSCCKRYIGILLGIFSSMMFALSVLIVKIMSGYHPYSVSFWRFQGILLPSIPVLLYCWGVKNQPVFNTIWPLSDPKRLKTFLFIFLRGLTGASAVVLQFYSLQFMSMADSSVIAFSTPVFVSLASHIFLGEKSGFVPIICGVITLAGVVIITRPPILTGGDDFDSDMLTGTGMALGCMVCATMTFLLLRYLRQVHFAVMTGYFGAWGSIQATLLALFFAEFQLPSGLHDWLMGTALALFTFIGLTSITIASKYEQASIISLCRTCDILFAYLWQFVFLGVTPDGYSLLGGAVVISGVLLAALRKFISELPEESATRKRFRLLLI